MTPRVGGSPILGDGKKYRRELTFSVKLDVRTHLWEHWGSKRIIMQVPGPEVSPVHPTRDIYSV